MEREKKELTKAAPQRAFDPLPNGHTAPETHITIPQNCSTDEDVTDESPGWGAESVGPTVLVYSSSQVNSNA